MILYHGSFLEIPHPDLNHSRSNVDLGVDFIPLRSGNRQKNGVENSSAAEKKELFPAMNLMSLSVTDSKCSDLKLTRKNGWTLS